MHFTEDEKWCRSDSKKKQIVALEVKDRVDDTPVRGQGCFLTSTKEAMQKSAIQLCEPDSFEEATMEQNGKLQ